VRPPMRRAVLVLVPVVEGVENGEEGGEGVAQGFGVNGSGSGVGGFHGRDILAAQPTSLLSSAARHWKSLGGEPVRVSQSNFAVKETGAVTIFAVLR